jgi:uncharacterized protein YkwD
MKTRTLRIVLLAAVLAAFLGVQSGRALTTRQVSDRRQMLVATNDTRRSHELHRVRKNDRMSELARRHSAVMAKSGDLFHVANPSPYYLKGKRWSWWGENVGVTAGGVNDLERAFMDSPPHRANILNRTFDHVAIGAVRKDGLLWVTVFFWG